MAEGLSIYQLRYRRGAGAQTQGMASYLLFTYIPSSPELSAGHEPLGVR